MTSSPRGKEERLGSMRVGTLALKACVFLGVYAR